MFLWIAINLLALFRRGNSSGTSMRFNDSLNGVYPDKRRSMYFSPGKRSKTTKLYPSPLFLGSIESQPLHVLVALDEGNRWAYIITVMTVA